MRKEFKVLISKFNLESLKCIEDIYILLKYNYLKEMLNGRGACHDDSQIQKYEIEMISRGRTRKTSENIPEF